MEKQLHNPAKNSVKRDPLLDESHATLNDERLYKGEKTQQGNEVMKRISDATRHRKTGPENASRLAKTKPTNQL